MGVNNVDVEMFLGGVWQEQVQAKGDAPAGADVFSAEGITVYKGGDSETDLRPHKIILAFNDETGRYRVSDPESPLYGQAGRNTGVRVAVNGTLRTTCEASSWRPDRTIDFGPGRGRARVTLTAEGVLRRLGQWTEPLRSALYRRIVRYSTLVGYWSHEEGKGSTSISNAVKNGIPGAAQSVEFAGGDGPGGSEPVVKLTAGGKLGGNFVSASTSAGWQFCFSIKLDTMPPVGFSPMIWWTTTNGYTHWWDVDAGGYRWTIRDSLGTLLYSTTVAMAVDPTKWVIFQAKCQASGGTVFIDYWHYQENDPVLYGLNDSYAGTIGRLNRWGVTQTTGNLNALYGHVFGLTTVADVLLSSTTLASFNGYIGERAGTRWLRLLGEEGITRFVISDVSAASDTMTMGIQRANTLVALLKECTDTDDGRFDDERFTLGALTLRTRRSMLNATPALALTYPDDISPPFEEETDDKNTGNRVTVKNVTGEEFTATLETGRMSILPPPAGVSEYKRTVDVSVSVSSDLAMLAGWHLSKGTLDRPRYESVTVDLIANPHLEAAAKLVREGDTITITGLEPEIVYLIVIGIVERIGHSTRTMTFTTRPGDLYRVGVYDSALTRYDSHSTLNAGVNTTATALTFTFTDRMEAWSTTAVPYDVTIAGERVRVTAMGAVSGAGPFTQAATVQRSQNGVVKSLAAGEEVHVSQVARYAL